MSIVWTTRRQLREFTVRGMSGRCRSQATSRVWPAIVNIALDQAGFLSATKSAR